MKYLDVDRIGLVSRIGLGTWQFGSREWGYGEQYSSGAARDIVQRARALGVTLFDTAEVYGLGRSEHILGEAPATTAPTSWSQAKSSPSRRSRR
jgi:aryl-alcohol dehydrogenase-like predicted oxidoreductase